jgi:hypothetical protein
MCRVSFSCPHLASPMNDVKECDDIEARDDIEAHDDIKACDKGAHTFP